MEAITLIATRPIPPITSLTPDFIPRGAPRPVEEPLWQGITEGRAFNPGWLPYIDERAV